MKIKTIRIFPSTWDIDIVISSNKKKLKILSEKRYGLINDPLGYNECNSIDTSINCELKGKRIVVVILKTLKDRKIIVHELVHALWHISNYIGYKMTYDTQEWQAVLFEYLYEQIIDKKGYNEIKYDNNN